MFSLELYARGIKKWIPFGKSYKRKGFAKRKKTNLKKYKFGRLRVVERCKK